MHPFRLHPEKFVRGMVVGVGRRRGKSDLSDTQVSVERPHQDSNSPTGNYPLTRFVP
jgi:hypothetical protein